MKNIETLIDEYMYHSFLNYERREESRDVYVNLGDGKPYIPVNDWKNGRRMSKENIVAFAEHFRRLGWDEAIAEMKEEKDGEESS